MQSTDELLVEFANEIRGRSGGREDALTYEKMTDDLAALLDHLHTGPANVLGWSDGGIQALLLGIRYPTKVKKIVAMAANLNPTADAIHPDVLTWMASYVDETPSGDMPQDRRARKVAEIMLDQPQIDPQLLESNCRPHADHSGRSRHDS